MENTKVFILNLTNYNVYDIANDIVGIDDTLSLSSMFTTSSEDALYGINKYFIDPLTLNLSYKNNALLCIYTRNCESTGITLEDFYNNSIFIISVEEYNNIPDMFFSKHNILTVLLDSHIEKCKINKLELKYLNERLDVNPNIYFIDEPNSKIESTIIRYLNSSEEEQQKIIEENS